VLPPAAAAVAAVVAACAAAGRACRHVRQPRCEISMIRLLHAGRQHHADL
jgi:hypothetical protein